MMRKYSLLFAAALLACVFQTAYAAEDMDDDHGNPAFMQQDAPFHRGGWGGGFGPMRMMRYGMQGKAPGMPFMRQWTGDEGEGFAHDGGMRLGMFNPRFMAQLGLTAEQKEKIINLETENFHERLRLRWELTAAQEKLRDLSEADIPDYTAIVAVNEELGGLRGKLDVTHRKVQEQLDAVLTPEQREQMEKAMEDGWERKGRGEQPERDERPRKDHPDSRRPRR